MRPFRTILFAADFSENSIDAFRVACLLASRDQALLILFHVIDENRAEGMPASTEIEALEALREKQMLDLYVTQRPIELAYRTSSGPAAAEIVRTAEEVGADLIVLGTHGRAGLSRLLAGSVAEAVLREARCPVMALHSDESLRLPEKVGVILHPMAISEDCAYTLHASATLAASLGARLIILHVSPRGILMNGSLAPRIEPRVYRHFLDQVSKAAEESGLEHPADIRLSWGSVTDEIISTANEVGSDVIVMGTRGPSWPRLLLMGSVARSVLQRVDRPVLLIEARRPDPSTCADPAADESALSSYDRPGTPAL
jgi:nucleotide-binding universal stress UspA family protein